MAFVIEAPALTAAYCHCADRKRWTGAPLPAFAVFAACDFDPECSGAVPSATPNGVGRWHCARCGSPIAARFDYLPDQIYVPIGVMNDASALAPELHCHANGMEPWLHMTDTLPRHADTATDTLKSAG